MTRPSVVIRKLNLAGEEVFSYSGEVVSRTPTAIVVEARFTRHDRFDLGYTVFERGDRFVEHFYTDRWYNIFEIHAVGTDELRGWYCNITRPAVIADEAVSAVDLALDVFVYPDGRMLLLDEDEFSGLSPTNYEKKAARMAVDELRQMVENGMAPFKRRDLSGLEDPKGLYGTSNTDRVGN